MKNLKPEIETLLRKSFYDLIVNEGGDDDFAHEEPVIVVNRLISRVNDDNDVLTGVNLNSDNEIISFYHILKEHIKENEPIEITAKMVYERLNIHQRKYLSDLGSDLNDESTSNESPNDIKEMNDFITKNGGEKFILMVKFYMAAYGVMGYEEFEKITLIKDMINDYNSLHTLLKIWAWS